MFANICFRWLDNLTRIRKFIYLWYKKNAPYYFYQYVGIDSSISDSREQDQGKLLFSVCIFFIYFQ